MDPLIAVRDESIGGSRARAETGRFISRKFKFGYKGELEVEDSSEATRHSRLYSTNTWEPSTCSWRAIIALEKEALLHEGPLKYDIVTTTDHGDHDDHEALSRL